MQRLHAAKVAIRQDALDPVGLRLREEAAVLLLPMASSKPGCLAILHINLGKPAELSEVDIHHLDLKPKDLS